MPHPTSGPHSTWRLPECFICMHACTRTHTHTHTIMESHHHFPLWSGCVTTSSASCRLISNCKASLIFYLGSRVTVGLRCLQPPACSVTRESATCLSDAKRGEPRQNGTLPVWLPGSRVVGGKQQPDVTMYRSRAAIRSRHSSGASIREKRWEKQLTTWAK